MDILDIALFDFVLGFLTGLLIVALFFFVPLAIAAFISDIKSNGDHNGL